MFDSVIVHCTSRDCDGTIEFQSKAGECVLQNYTPHAVPMPIAGDLDGDTQSCGKCGRVHRLHAPGARGLVTMTVSSE
jgi:hypothetical protein